MPNARIRVFSAARMLAIEAQAVVNGLVQGDNLILTRNNGETINAGNVRGPQGPPGLGLDAVAGVQARLSAATRGPVKIAFLGSSTTEGLGATTPNHRWANVMTRILQNAYPSGVASWEPPVASLSDAVSPSLPGIWAANGGVGSTFSNTYINSTRRAQLDAFEPSLIFHMIGSNDHALGTNPVDYQANLESQLDQLDAVLPNTMHVLCDTFARADIQNPAYPWTDYVSAMVAIAGSRSNVIFAGQLDEWVAGQATGYNPVDPWRLTRWRIGAGGDIHPSDAGHLLLAKNVARCLSIPSGHERVQPEVLDRFQRTVLGGAETGQSWEQQSGVHVPVDGALSCNTAGNAVITTGFSDVEISALVRVSANSVQGLIAKSNDSSTRIGVYFNGPSGRMELWAGASILTWSTTGHGVGLTSGTEHLFVHRVVGDQVHVLLDGQTIFTHTLSSSLAATYANYRKHGVRCNTTDSTVRWRNLAIRAA